QRFGDPEQDSETGSTSVAAPSCMIPDRRSVEIPLQLDEPLERLVSRVMGVLALVWGVSAERAEREMSRALAGSALTGERLAESGAPREAGNEKDIVPLDGWRARPRRRRMRVDRRQGR